MKALNGRYNLGITAVGDGTSRIAWVRVPKGDRAAGLLAEFVGHEGLPAYWHFVIVDYVQASEPYHALADGIKAKCWQGIKELLDG